MCGGILWIGIFLVGVLFERQDLHICAIFVNVFADDERQQLCYAGRSYEAKKLQISLIHT